jgi:hypothetical protein
MSRSLSKSSADVRLGAAAVVVFKGAGFDVSVSAALRFGFQQDSAQRRPEPPPRVVPRG